MLKLKKQTPLTTEFVFAGFSWPRYVVDLPKGEKALRAKWKGRQFTGGYFHKPPPNSKVGKGFYLERTGKVGAGQPFSRWDWADEVCSTVAHTGWFSDEYGYSEKIRGLIAYLPHGRFLAGWSMGVGMCAEVDGELFTDKFEAAQAADEMARIVAEKEIEYQREQVEDESYA